MNEFPVIAGKTNGFSRFFIIPLLEGYGLKSAELVQHFVFNAHINAYSLFF